MNRALVFDPLVPWPVLAGLAVFAGVLVGLAVWRGLWGWPLRAGAALALLAALGNPVLQEEQRKPLSDIVILVVDESASQKLGDRAAQTEATVAAVQVFRRNWRGLPTPKCGWCGLVTGRRMRARWR
jgi:hypothetical protein